MKLKKVLPLIIMAAFVAAAAVFLALHGSISVEELLNWSPENKWLAALVALAAYAVKSQTVVIPYALIAAAVGLVFDLPLALCINALGSVICISVPYFTGRGSDGVLVDSLLGRHPRIRKVYEENKRHLFLVSLVLRVTNLSNDLLGLFFGSLRMKYGEYPAQQLHRHTAGDGALHRAGQRPRPAERARPDMPGRGRAEHSALLAAPAPQAPGGRRRDR